MRFRNSIAALVLTGLLVQSARPAYALGPLECPLRSPRFKTLYDAALALSASVSLQGDCEGERKKLEGAHAQLVSSASQLKPAAADPAAPAPAPGPSTADPAALMAVQNISNSIQTIGGVLSSTTGGGACGKQLLGNAGYVSALLDTIVHTMPFFMLYGGAKAAPIAITGMVVGSIVKVGFDMYVEKKERMKDPQKRKAFIENACGFYQLNEIVQTMESNGTQQRATLEEQRKQLDAQLHTLIKSEPPKPSSNGMVLELDRAAESEAALKGIRDTLGRQTSNTLKCAMIQELVDRAASQQGFPSRLTARLKELLEEDKNAGEQVYGETLALNAFLRLSDIKNFPLDKADACATAADAWLSAADGLVQTLKVELGKPTRQQKLEQEDQDTKAFATYRQWKSDLSTARRDLEDVKNRIRFLDALQADNSQVDLSELNDMHQSVRKTLFEDSAFRTSISGEWLHFKFGAAADRIKEFSDRASQIKAEDGKVKQTDAQKCASYKAAWQLWSSASRDVKAATQFCWTFRAFIKTTPRSKAGRLCYGTGPAEYDMPVMSSYPNLTVAPAHISISDDEAMGQSQLAKHFASVNAAQAQADELLKKIDGLKCGAGELPPID